MADTSTDRWAAGDAYEAYMGRWSRRVADEFVHWLTPQRAAHWLEVGCGTGALTSAICRLCEPSSVVACDQSSPFVEHARATIQHPGASFTVASIDTLPTRGEGFDLIVSGLVLNFIAQPDAALAAMRTRARPGGVVAAYIWDYTGGLEFLHYFWREAAVLDPRAEPLDESLRFAAWTRAYLASCFETAGLTSVDSTVLVVPTSFTNFDEYWIPFLGGTGPAPGYVASLSLFQRDRLAQRLRSRLPRANDGTLRLQASALAVRGIRP
jgi:trans-aconitate methyltransferase